MELHSTAEENMEVEIKIDDELLINEARNYRCLWDTSTRAFKDNNKKNEAWKTMASKLESDGKSFLFSHDISQLFLSISKKTFRLFLSWCLAVKIFDHSKSKSKFWTQMFGVWKQTKQKIL